MLICSKGDYDYTQANTKVNNSHIMINLRKTFPEHFQNVGTDITLWEPSDNFQQTLCVSWEASYELHLLVPVVVVARLFCSYSKLHSDNK